MYLMNILQIQRYTEWLEGKQLASRKGNLVISVSELSLVRDASPQRAQAHSPLCLRL
jgi:hypothetical protein